MTLQPALMTIPHPDPLPLPAPAILLWALLLLTFLVHLLAMNFVLGGSIVAIVSAKRARYDTLHYGMLATRLAKAMPVAVAATISSGVAPLLFLQTLYGRLFFTSSILMGWFWFAVVPLLILAYYGTYAIAMGRDSERRPRTAIRWVVALLLTAIAFLYTNNTSLMLRPEAFREMYLEDRGGLWLNLQDFTLIPRYLHIFMGALAVAGMVVALHGLKRLRTEPEFADWAMRFGCKWFAAVTALNLLAGTAWLLALPSESLDRFMGGDLASTIYLAVGVLLGLATLVQAIVASRAADPAPKVRITTIHLLFTLVAMILVRDGVRQGALQMMAFDRASWVEPQWGNIFLFLVLLAGAVGTVTWMVKLLRGSRRAKRT